MSNELILSRRIAALEAQVAHLYQHLNIAPPAGPPGVGIVPPEVLAFLNAGDKIGAIKAYREVSGAGLAEAKAFVDGLG